jgi:membrane-associated phospholipid phosphatase
MSALARAVRRLTLRFRLTGRGLALLALAICTIVGSSALLLGIGEDVTQGNGQAVEDAGHLKLFVDHRPTMLVTTARIVTSFGAAPLLGVLAVVAAGLLWWRGQRLIVAVAPAVALGVTGVAVAVAKLVVSRARPDLPLRLVPDSEPSFPSGHAADSAALLITLALVVAAVLLRRPLARAVLVAGAGVATGAIGLSRLVLAAHWPTDVLAGWALGLLVGVVVSTVAILAARGVPADPSQATRLRARASALLLASRSGSPRGKGGLQERAGAVVP